MHDDWISCSILYVKPRALILDQALPGMHPSHGAGNATAAARFLMAQEPRQALWHADCATRAERNTNALLLTLRAEAFLRVGDLSAALADARRAIGIEPENLWANRVLLRHGQPAERTHAARLLTAIDTHLDTLQRATSHLRASGVAAMGSARVRDGEISGWAAWWGCETLRVCLRETAGLDIEFDLRPARAHPLADEHIKAASFRSRIANARGAWRGESSDVGRLVLKPSLRARQPQAHAPDDASRVAAELAAAAVAIVIPVWGDPETADACFRSLRTALASGSFKTAVIVVDDASPDPSMRSLLDSLPFIILRNRVNLGFAGAVNRALRLIRDQDVLLLNSDTIVAPGFVERLREAASSSPDIGTVTPLSNNGELTSLPQPFQANAMPSYEEIVDIDAAAQQLNSGRVIDIPSGIGFCLYVTRRCLDAVGDMPEPFDRGYYEDVQLCLEAREKGWRNVCAASVFVGHWGTRSFTTEKRTLVKRNLRRLQARFPSHHQETTAFVAADPLAKARRAVSLGYRPSGSLNLVLTGPLTTEIAQQRAAWAASQGLNSLIGVVGRDEIALSFLLDGRHRPWGVFPRRQGSDCLKSSLRHLAIDRIEVLDPSLAGLEHVSDLAAPRSLYLADGTALCARIGEALILPHASAPAGAQANGIRGRMRAAAQDICEALPTFSEVKLPDRSAFFLSHVLPYHSTSSDAPWPTRSPEQTMRKPRRLGILAPYLSAYSQMLLRRLMMQRDAIRSDAAAPVLLGHMPVSFGAWQQENIFVTGPLLSAEVAQAVSTHDISHVLLLNTSPVFGLPVFSEAGKLPHPIALFDWSFGKAPGPAGDLLIDAQASIDRVVASVMAWFDDAPAPRAARGMADE